MKPILQMAKIYEMYNLHKMVKRAGKNKNVREKSYPQFNCKKAPKIELYTKLFTLSTKNGAIFELKKTGKKEQLFCEEVINFPKNRKNFNL